MLCRVLAVAHQLYRPADVGHVEVDAARRAHGPVRPLRAQVRAPKHRRACAIELVQVLRLERALLRADAEPAAALREDAGVEGTDSGERLRFDSREALNGEVGREATQQAFSPATKTKSRKCKRSIDGVVGSEEKTLVDVAWHKTYIWVTHGHVILKNLVTFSEPSCYIT